MGSYRVNGPTGRDQTYVPGGDPTQRKGQAQGEKEITIKIKWAASRGRVLGLGLAVEGVGWGELGSLGLEGEEGELPSRLDRAH